jgi:conjugative relaxase-like TrwC/TraI family protein
MVPGVGHLGFVARSDWRYLVAHAREAGEPGLEPGPGGAAGGVGGVGNYYMKVAEAGEPAGRWFGPGASVLGFAPDQVVTAAAMETVFGKLRDPATGFSLGSRPRKYASFEERLARVLAAEPGADAERVTELRFAARTQQREAAHYYDLTFSPTKSWSVLFAGLRAAGMDAEAETLWSCLMEGYQAGLVEAMDSAGYVRTGRHSGRALAGRSAGRWEHAEDWTSALFAHHTSRAGDPQLHIHGAVLNRARAAGFDGQVRWFAVDGTALKNVRRSAAATMSRVAESLAVERLGVSFVDRPDGLGREIAGVEASLLEHFSNRRRAIEPVVARIAEEYRAAYDKDPDAYELRLMSEQATLTTRQRKPEHPPTGPELLASWEDSVQRTGRSLTEVPEATGARCTDPASEPTEPEPFEGEGPRPGSLEWLDTVLGPGQRELVVEAALADVTGRMTTFGRAELRASIDTRLPAATLEIVPAAQQGQLLDALTDLAVVHPDAVLLSAPPLIPAPTGWRRPVDGRGLHEPPTAYDRWTGAATLSREARVLEAALELGAPAAERTTAQALLDATTLRPGQRAAVDRILTSGRQVDLLVGPAGTGKSYTLAELARLWTESVGGEECPRVLGLATSEAAVRVLQEHGIDRAVNVERFLRTRELARSGIEPRSGRDHPIHIRRGDLVIVDEASMVTTGHAEAIVSAARVQGAKLVLAGDDKQLDSIGAGGVFGLLIERTRPVVLDEVVRFTNSWEGPASLRLREGDVSVIAEYARRGRIEAGARDDLLVAACRGFVADHLTGRSSVVITPTNEQAAEVASHVRAQLVGLGRVEADGVRLHDANKAGVGDLIATRRNDRRLDDGAGGWIANRDVFHVLERHGDGGLTVARDLGPDDTGTNRMGSPVVLPADYVAEQVELAYAATAHAAQGRTVDTCTALVDPTMNLAALYVAATRARERTLLAVPTDAEPVDALGQQDPQREPITPEAVLAGIIGRPQEPGSATQLLAAEIDARESLARLAPEWADLITRDTHARFRNELQRALGPEQWSQVANDPALGPLLRAIRAAETDGALDHHELAELVRRAVTSKELDTAESIAAVLHHRVTGDLPRPGRREPASFLERTPVLSDPGLDAYARAIAVAMDERVQALGDRAAADPPAWIADLGPVPSDPALRAEWVRRAGTVAGYREQDGHRHGVDPIGPAPSMAAVEQRADWETAWRALGRADEYRLHAAATTGQLLNTVLAWQRFEAMAPPNVDEEMRATARTADYCDREARHLQAGAAGDPSPLQTVASFRTAEAQARSHLAKLEEAAADRTAWRLATEPERRSAVMAKAELDRRVTGALTDPAEPMPDPIVDPSGDTSGAGRNVEPGFVDRDGYDAMCVGRADPGIEI